MDSTLVPAAATEAARRTRPSLRPLALPNEHGGWGFLLEPLVLGLLVKPSIAGALVALAAVLGFLTRHPLKCALQDLQRGRSYPRTRYCWMLAGTYATGAAAALAAAIAAGRLILVIPFGLVAPLAMTIVLYDAYNRSRAMFPEMAGAAAMSSTAAAIVIAGGGRMLPALALSGIIIARSLPSILYVRTLLKRARKMTASSWPALIAHVVAAFAVATFAPLLAVVAMVVLLVRAAWGLAHDPPRAQTIGWIEITIGALFVLCVAAGLLTGQAGYSTHFAMNRFVM
ncbi:MAG TPA: YwiC-like family protein [Thermoanaerobaculia bacterium]|nr:YwiC-like family protein [Thermoanaerobaculia bacterium]